MKKKKHKKKEENGLKFNNNNENEMRRGQSMGVYEKSANSKDEFELEKDEILLNEPNFWSATDQEVLCVNTTSSEESENEDEVNIGNWGGSKKNYYNADILSEEDILEEEKEVLRLQKLHFSKMKEEDFLDDLKEWNDEDTEQKNIDDKIEIITEISQHDIPDDLSDEKAIDLLEKIYPEFTLLSNEYQSLFPLLDPLKTLYEKTTCFQKKLVEQKFFSLSAYLGVLAMYFSIILDPDKDVVSMKDHPIMISLIRCKKLWEMVKNIDVNATVVDTETLSEKENTIGNLTDKEDLFRESVLNFNDLNILDVERSLKSIKDASDNRLKDDDYKENSFKIFNPNDKNTKRKSLKFYTAEINQKIAKKVRFSSSGDADLPYLESKDQHIMPSINGADEGIEEQNDIFSDSNSDLQNDDSDENYYNMLSDTNKKRKIVKKINYDIKRQYEKQALMDTENEIVNGKRKIRYDIEKNKGLIPYRPKEVRNPRVKKRKKYEEAKKKLASKTAIYKGIPKDGYKGETTGIKTHLFSNRLLLFISLFMLFHGGYSAHKIVSLIKSNNQEEVIIPINIIIEVILSLIIFCIERVLYTGKLQPINHSDYISMQKESNNMVHTILTYRPGFIDIRQKRKQYENSGKKHNKL
ncbi:hypothetical protein PCANB_001286 [Pneumocystis canis]|nr:hypothetical protein PCANB_001286 [Pneumocystis canis]